MTGTVEIKSEPSGGLAVCMVSMVMDAGAKIPPYQWTPQVYLDFQEVIRRLDAIDRKLGQPECHDPAKGEWMRGVEERLRRLEEAAGVGRLSNLTVGGEGWQP